MGRISHTQEATEHQSLVDLSKHLVLKGLYFILMVDPVYLSVQRTLNFYTDQPGRNKTTKLNTYKKLSLILYTLK
jgi:hypothetical protein